MAVLAALLLLLQVDPFKVDSKKITPEVTKSIEKLDAIRNDAFEQAKRQLSATLPAKFQIILDAVDAADPDPAKFTRHSGVSADTSSRAEGIVRIRYYVEYFRNGLGTPESTLRHEMVHAVMRLALGNEKYRTVPKWFREGTAVFIAGQMDEKFNTGVMQPETARQPGKMVDGLEDDDHGLDDYWEDAMAIVFLSERPMRSPISEVLTGMREGKDFKDAIAAVAGGTYGDFVAGAYDHALKSLRARTIGMKTMLSTYSTIAQQNEKSADLCQIFLEKWPKSPLTSAVLYYKAKSASSDAIARFDDFIASAYGPDGKVDFIDDAKIRKARLLAKEKKTKEAAAVYSDLVYWHVGSHAAVDALYEWGLLEKRIPLLKRALELEPKHRLAEQARKAMGD